MKKLYFVSVSFCLVILMLLAASCTESGDYRKAVPENAVVVVSMDLAQLGEDANLKDSGVLSIMKGFVSLLGGAEMQAGFGEFLSDPSILGIDFDRPAFFFLTQDSYMGVVMSVAKEENLETTLSKLNDLGLIGRIEEEDGVSVADVDATMVIAYDESCLLLCYSDNTSPVAELRSKATEWIGQEKEEQFLINHDVFADGGDAPVTCFVSGRVYKTIEGTGGSDEFEEMRRFLPKGVALSDLDMLFALSFENNEAVLRAKASSKNEEARQVLEEYAEVFKEIDGDFLDYSSDEDLVVVLNCKGEGVVSYLKQIPEMEALIEETAGAGFDLTRALENCDGDVMVTMSDLDTSSPEFGVFAKVKDTNVIRSLIEMARALRVNIASRGENEYIFYDDNKPYYLTVGDDRIMVTTQAPEDLKEGRGISKSDLGESVFYVSCSASFSEEITGGFLNKVELRGTLKGGVEMRMTAEEESELFLEGLLNAYMRSMMGFN